VGVTFHSRTRASIAPGDRAGAPADPAGSGQRTLRWVLNYFGSAGIDGKLITEHDRADRPLVRLPAGRVFPVRADCILGPFDSEGAAMDAGVRQRLARFSFQGTWQFPSDLNIVDWLEQRECADELTDEDLGERLRAWHAAPVGISAAHDRREGRRVARSRAAAGEAVRDRIQVGGHTGSFHYHRIPDADLQEMSWILAGVDAGQRIGDFGISSAAAASGSGDRSRGPDVRNAAAHLHCRSGSEPE